MLRCGVDGELDFLVEMELSGTTKGWVTEVTEVGNVLEMFNSIIFYSFFGCQMQTSPYFVTVTIILINIPNAVNVCQPVFACVRYGRSSNIYH